MTRWFQTNSREVEATSPTVTRFGSVGFRRTLVRLKHRFKAGKHYHPPFQTNSREVEASSSIWFDIATQTVSDELS